MMLNHAEREKQSFIFRKSCDNKTSTSAKPLNKITHFHFHILDYGMSFLNIYRISEKEGLF